MNFGFTEEQELLRAQALKLVQSSSPLSEVRRVARSPLGHDPALWKQLAELGMVGLLVPERYGGAGLGWVDVVVLLEATGRGLVPSPLLSTLLASAAIAEHGSEEQRAAWLPRIARGELVATVALLERDQRVAAAGVQARASKAGDEWVLDG